MDLLLAHILGMRKLRTRGIKWPSTELLIIEYTIPWYRSLLLKLPPFYPQPSLLSSLFCSFPESWVYELFTLGFQVDEMPTEGFKFLNLSETAPMWLVRSCLIRMTVFHIHYMEWEIDFFFKYKLDKLTVFMALFPITYVTLDPATPCKISELSFIWLLIIRAVNWGLIFAKALVHNSKFLNQQKVFLPVIKRTLD